MQIRELWGVNGMGWIEKDGWMLAICNILRKAQV